MMCCIIFRAVKRSFLFCVNTQTDRQTGRARYTRATRRYRRRLLSVKTHQSHNGELSESFLTCGFSSINVCMRDKILKCNFLLKYLIRELRIAEVNTGIFKFSNQEGDTLDFVQVV